QQLCGLQSNAGNATQLEHTCRNILCQFLKVSRFSRFHDFEYLSADGLADAWNLLEFSSPALCNDIDYWRSHRTYRFGSHGIRPLFERVLIFELHNIGDLLQDSCDLGVVRRLIRKIIAHSFSLSITSRWVKSFSI